MTPASAGRRDTAAGTACSHLGARWSCPVSPACSAAITYEAMRSIAAPTSDNWGASAATVDIISGAGEGAALIHHPVAATVADAHTGTGPPPSPVTPSPPGAFHCMLSRQP